MKSTEQLSIPFLHIFPEYVGVYLVGGYVRDFFLERDSKDIDVLVNYITFDDLLSLLNQHGIAELVGKSSDCVKFKYQGITYDIVLPKEVVRSEDGYRQASNPKLSIERDLASRDFTMNAIAFDLRTREFVDPMNGRQDIESKIIRNCSVYTYLVDPVRILRGINFSFKFDMQICEDAEQLMSEAQSDLSLSSRDRILIELEKMCQQTGKMSYILWFMDVNGILTDIFYKSNVHIDESANSISDIASLFHYIAYTNTDQYPLSNEQVSRMFALNELARPLPDSLYNSQANGLEATNAKLAFTYKCIYEAVQLDKTILDDYPYIYNLVNKKTIDRFKEQMPKRKGELAIDGGQLFKYGFQGKAIGDILEVLLDKVLKGTPNTFESLLRFVPFTPEISKKEFGVQLGDIVSHRDNIDSMGVVSKFNPTTMECSVTWLKMGDKYSVFDTSKAKVYHKNNLNFAT